MYSMADVYFQVAVFTVHSHPLTCERTDQRQVCINMVLGNTTYFHRPCLLRSVTKLTPVWVLWGALSFVERHVHAGIEGIVVRSRMLIGALPCGVIPGLQYSNSANMNVVIVALCLWKEEIYTTRAVWLKQVDFVRFMVRLA